jgi:hypothetical protein
MYQLYTHFITYLFERKTKCLSDTLLLRFVVQYVQYVQYVRFTLWLEVCHFITLKFLLLFQYYWNSFFSITNCIALCASFDFPRIWILHAFCAAITLHQALSVATIALVGPLHEQLFNLFFILPFFTPFWMVYIFSLNATSFYSQSIIIHSFFIIFKVIFIAFIIYYFP